jgi:hypothetical protein
VNEVETTLDKRRGSGLAWEAVGGGGRGSEQKAVMVKNANNGAGGTNRPWRVLPGGKSIK